MAASKAPEYLGEPTLAQVMRRPRWILALLLALAVAAGFALLAQWQAGHAIQTQTLQGTDSETPRPLVDAASISKGVTDEGAEIVVLVNGQFADADFDVVTSRMNDGVEGAWVIGNLVTEAPNAEPGAHLAVAVGWAPTEESARAAAEKLSRDPELLDGALLEGRYMIPEAPQVPRGDVDPFQLDAMSPAQLANVWQYVDGPVYSGFLVLHPQGVTAEAVAQLGLDPINSVAPVPADTVNWLNVFYALEWLVFGGFAVFFWYRLSRDAWEKEHEMQALEAESAAEITDGPGSAVAAGPSARKVD